MKVNNDLLKEVVVIISTRNRIAELLITIKKCLEIGLQQNQLFVADDSSTDGTPEQLGQRFPEIVLKVNTVQAGYIQNRNFMMKHSQGRFILSLDDDSNLLSRQDLEDALFLLESNEKYGIFGFTPIEQLAPITSVDHLSNEVFVSSWYIGCGHIIKRSTLDRVGLYREEFVFYGEEVDFSIRCFKEDMLVVKKRNLVVHHRVDYKNRDTTINGDKNRGEYGILWRSELAMTNRLTNVLLHYPATVAPYYFLKVLTSFFLNYVIKKKWISCYRNALALLAKRSAYIKRERNPLTFKQFQEYMKLEE